MDGRARGIDVSHNNGVVNWPSIAAAGISFAFAKASQGATFQDPKFRDNWQGMKDAGIVRGAYHFLGFVDPTTQSGWKDDVHRQIDQFLAMVQPLQAGDLPPTLDLEALDSPPKWASLIKKDRGAALAVVRELISYCSVQLQGVLPILYTGSFWWSDLADPDPTEDNMPFTTHPLWFAQYPQVHAPVPIQGPPGAMDNGEASNFDEYASRLDGKQPRRIPKVWQNPGNSSWTFWQFTEYGKHSNWMPGFVDLDVFNGPPSDLKRLCIV
jgi:lysozyme